MYRIILAIQNEELLKGITTLHIWGEATDFEITTIKNSIETATDELKKNQYDLLIAEVSPTDDSIFSKLKFIKAEGLCRRIALCSSTGDFKTAREGIIIGAYEYFVMPIEQNAFIRLFTRIKNETNSSMASEIYYFDEIINLFENRDSSIIEYIDNISERDSFAKTLKSVMHKIFEDSEWLDLYLSERDFMELENNDTEKLKNSFRQLFEVYCELYPSHNEKIHSVIDYILFNPESDLRQKTLSEELFINSSYLSTMFTAQTEIRFVDYVTLVKLSRAGWLLKNTDMKVIEIAKRLDYKDIGYFSKQFKKIFGLTPSEYRIPDDYVFQI